MRRLAWMAILLVLLGLAAHAASFPTPVTNASLDSATFASWYDGTEHLLTTATTDIIWTTTTTPANGISFGDSKTPGWRFVRVGFKAALPVGSVVVRGGGQLSVLKSTAVYPGDLTDDSQWIPAQRIVDGNISMQEVGSDNYAVWVLPPGTTTQALRFAHEAAVTDISYAGNLGSACVLSERMVNMAPQAIPVAERSNEAAFRLVNESNDGTWNAWSNGNDRATVITQQDPETVTLVWPTAVPLNGMNALWAGFAACDVEYYSGPADVHPLEAPAGDWTRINSYSGLLNHYWRALGNNWMGFGSTLTTRAIRVKMTQATAESHPHLVGKTRDGKRVWLGELMALSALGTADLSTAILPSTAILHAPIPLQFTLPEAGYVTLVIEDATTGKRVRNLVSETYYPAGDNVAYWDATNDLGRDADAAHHGIYHIPSTFVAPGNYRVRGLFRRGIDTRYEFSVYNAGTPAWNTQDHTGAWLANHTPPSAALFLPASAEIGNTDMMLLGCHVTEGPDGLAWVDLTGRKLGGRTWVGGIWTAAQFLARDSGANAVPGIIAYVGSAFDAELRLTGLAGLSTNNSSSDKNIIIYKFPGGTEEAVLGGMAVRGGLLVCSLPKRNTLLFVDARGGSATGPVYGSVLGEVPCPDARGVAFDEQGQLYVLSGMQLLRAVLPADLAAFFAAPSPTLDFTALTTGLQNPQQLLYANNSLLVSDWGNSHQVKRFDLTGAFLGAIGTPGALSLGQYDRTHMNNPNGIAVDSLNQLWVAETNYQPKRVSVWTLDGQLLKTFYGPSEYGGGGTLDGADKQRFYYAGMQFALDWAQGTDQLQAVLMRPEFNTLQIPGGPPENPVTLNGRRYLTNTFNSHPTNGQSVVGIWRIDNDVAVPVAVIGEARQWSLINQCLGSFSSFSVRWTGQVQPRYSESYTFHTYSDDGVRLWVNGQLLIDDWTGHGTLERTGTIALTAGQRVDVKLEYFSGGGGADVKLSWNSASQPLEVVPASQLFPTVASTTPGGLTGKYYKGTSLSDLAYTQVDPVVQFTFTNGAISVPHDTALEAGLRARLPQGVSFNSDALLFAWSDANDDQQMQAEEVTFLKTLVGGVVVQSDLSVVTSVTTRLVPQGYTANGTPLYNVATASALVPGGRTPNTSGGGQSMLADNGWTIMTVPPEPYIAQSSMAGALNGVAMWSYPSLWPGLHPSHEAPVPDHPGELLGTTRLLGQFVTPPDSDAGPIWAINGNMGNVYLFTADGLFVATLFKDFRLGTSWRMPTGERGMLLNDLTLDGEDFWPSISQTPDGGIYLVDGSRTSLVRLEGLSSIRRMPAAAFTLTADDLLRAQQYIIALEASRQQEYGRKSMEVTLRRQAPIVDGRVDDWAYAPFVDIDKSGSAAYFDSNSKPHNVTGSITVAQGRLYGMIKADDANLLVNTGENLNALFKTGGALDVMIGANSAADPNRTAPVAGDMRLLITRVNGVKKAMLYRAVVPGSTTAPVPFSSPWRTIFFDEVKEVSADVELASYNEYDSSNVLIAAYYEFSIPLTTLGLTPAEEQTIQADLGILRGSAGQTIQRVYWNNKATAIVSDVPSEAQLTPNLWGNWHFTTLGFRVALTAPAAGATYVAPAAIPLEATATYGNAPVARVVFYNGTTPVGEDTTAPYTLNWSCPNAGRYTITARAYNDAGEYMDSAPVVVAVSAPAGTGTGLRGEYFANRYLTAPSALTREDPTVDFLWNSGAPATNMPVDNFSVRWTGSVEPRYSETYTFYTQTDDGVRLWVDGQLVINNWTDHGTTENSGTIALEGGKKYAIRLEYYENGGGATCRLLWSSISQAKQAIPQSQLYPLPPVVATPSMSPEGGTFTDGVTVTLACATAGATIHYTLDGSDPAVNGTVYAGPIAITRNTTVTAVATRTDWQTSATAQATYTIGMQAPTISPAGSTFTSQATVTLACASEGAVIRYTTDGSDPATNGIAYTAPFTLTQSATIKAQAVKAGCEPSSVLTANFTISVEAPTITPAGGTFTSQATVTLACATAGASICYTTDGSDPAVNGVAYTEPITLTRSATVKAIAEKAGCQSSSPVSAAFTIAVAEPSFTPAGGSYNDQVVVSLASATTGATIRYTLDGSDPAVTGVTYTGPFTLTQTTTVKALATKTGCEPSAPVATTYSITVTRLVVTPSAGANGTISPNTPQTVDVGTSLTFTAAPATGYLVDRWYLDGALVQTGGSQYLLANITSNHAVQVTFKAQTFTVTPSAGSGGTISPNTVQTVAYGASITFTATPATGYMVSTWTVNGVVQPITANQFTLTNVTGNRTVGVTFKLKTFTVTSSAGTGGSIKPPGVVTVSPGGSVTFTATAAKGYAVNVWLVDGIVVQTGGNRYTLKNVTANHTVQVTFRRK